MDKQIDPTLYKFINDHSYYIFTELLLTLLEKPYQQPQAVLLVEELERVARKMMKDIGVC